MSPAPRRTRARRHRAPSAPLERDALTTMPPPPMPAMSPRCDRDAPRQVTRASADCRYYRLRREAAEREERRLRAELSEYLDNIHACDERVLEMGGVL
jgi:hypothetical protein